MKNKKLKKVIRDILLGEIEYDLTEDATIETYFTVSRVQKECKDATREDIKEVLDELYNYDMPLKYNPMSKCRLLSFYCIEDNICEIGIPVKQLHEVIRENLLDEILNK